MAILSGRDPDKLNALGNAHPGLRLRPARVDDAVSLDRALVGASAVINCAGPFAQTAAPLIEAALRAKIPYLDVAAEIQTPRHRLRPMRAAVQLRRFRFLSRL
jgi:short subunit dehydrogenase-like uncharacterized protein